MIKKSRDFLEGSLYSNGDRDKAARMVAEGEIVGIFNRGVCALWFDGGNNRAVKRIWKIKGEGRKGKPVALTLDLEEFIPMIDTAFLPDDVKTLIVSPEFKSRVGSLCFIRAPISTFHQKSIPNHAKSIDADGICTIQNWDPHGATNTELFLNEVKKKGVKHPAVTSMNITGQPEIVDQKEGLKFCKKYGIRIFLEDPQAHPKHVGSYTIFTLDRGGIRLERDGNIPGRLFEKILGTSINAKYARKSNYPQLKFPKSLLKNLEGAKVREAILLYLQGET